MAFECLSDSCAYSIYRFLCFMYRWHMNVLYFVHGRHLKVLVFHLQTAFKVLVLHVKTAFEDFDDIWRLWSLMYMSHRNLFHHLQNKTNDGSCTESHSTMHRLENLCSMACLVVRQIQCFEIKDRSIFPLVQQIVSEHWIMIWSVCGALEVTKPSARKRATGPVIFMVHTWDTRLLINSWYKCR